MNKRTVTVGCLGCLLHLILFLIAGIGFFLLSTWAIDAWATYATDWVESRL